MQTRQIRGHSKRLSMATIVGALAGLMIMSTAVAQDASSESFEDLDDFGGLSLEELMRVPVTSVTGQEESLFGTPAAITVISNEDIRRGGHRTIADALRMVPGMQVGQITSNTWAVSARGFNGRFGDMLLVLIDGRAVYTPLFAGVFWDVQDVMLEDLDRIEVIRGPGATLWGANAVNGVINIVTRSAAETQGLLFTAGGGTIEEGFGAIRYGGQISENAHFRFWSKYDNRDQFKNPAGANQADDWHTWRSGFRVDISADDETTYFIEGDVFDGAHGSPWTLATLTPPFTETLRDDLDRDGGHLQVKMTRETGPSAWWSLKAYYDLDRFTSAVISEERQTYDVEFRHHSPLGDRHELIFGLGYRHYEDETRGSFAVSFDPAERSFDNFSAFVQDKIEIEPDRWTLLLGSKFEHNDFSGFEVQPSARLAWTPNDNETWWMSFSRAVRTPARVEDDLHLVRTIVPSPPATMPTPGRLLGDTETEAETLLAYELGYRVRPAEGLTLDIAAFVSDYEDLITITGPGPTPFDRRFINNQSAEAYGVEVALKWDVADNWRLSTAYTWMELQMHGGLETAEGDAPEHQFNIRSHLDLSDALEFNTNAYFVDRLTNQGAGSYTRLDLGLTWRPQSNVEVSVWGQNLLDGSHLEYTDPFLVGTPVEVQRGVYGQVTVRF